MHWPTQLLKISELRTELEERMAGSSPRLWVYQPHVALIGLVVGLILSLAAFVLPKFSSSENLVTPSIVVCFGFQFVVCMAWIFRSYSVTTPPKNLVEFRTFPYNVVIFLTCFLIMLGPISLLAYYYYSFGISESDAVFLKRDAPGGLGLVFLEVTFFVSVAVYGRGAGGGATIFSEIIPGSFLFLFIVSVFTLFFIWSGLGPFGITCWIAFILIVCITRLLFCLVNGRRTGWDSYLSAVGFIVLPPVLIVALNLFFLGNPERQTRLGGLSIASATWTMLLISLVFLIFWVDLSNMVLSRFWLLPRTER